MSKKQISKITDSLLLCLLAIIISSIIIASLWIAYYFINCTYNHNLVHVISLILAILLTIDIARFFIIGCVRLYRLVAPESLRGRCRFEPTCSAYMIIALRKYGTIVGLIKGLNRISRCHPPYGGVDEP